MSNVLKPDHRAPVSSLPSVTRISERSRALYLSPYERWERELVRHLNRQPHVPVEYLGDFARQGRPGLCHHNVAAYCRIDLRAKPVLGWLQDEHGYILHSVVELEGLLLEATPARWPVPFPFVPDDRLFLGWKALENGISRAVITRADREMPPSLRKPKAVRELRRFAENQHGHGNVGGL